jgi:hypothetical protein
VSRQLTMSAFEEILRKLYYDPSLPSSFGGTLRLYRAAKAHNISLKDVKQWLKAQIPYTIHRDVRRKFKRNKIIVRDKFEQLQIDLVDMLQYGSENDGFKYILTAIDCLTKYAWAIPLKRKADGNVLEALKKIVQEKHPQNINWDKGGEFSGKLVKSYLKAEGIHHFVTQNDVLKAPIVERFNRNLKERMFRYFTATGNRRYIDKLDELVVSYNNSYHRSIKMTPMDALNAGLPKLLSNLYGTTKLSELYDINAFKARKIGETVRLQKELLPFAKGYLPKWTEESFIVDKISKRKIPMYGLKDKKQEPIIGDSYKHEIQSIIETQDTRYRIDKVISRRGKGRGKEVFVSWLGYPEVFNSWIPENELKRL